MNSQTVELPVNGSIASHLHLRLSFNFIFLFTGNTDSPFLYISCDSTGTDILQKQQKIENYRPTRHQWGVRQIQQFWQPMTTQVSGSWPLFKCKQDSDEDTD